MKSIDVYVRFASDDDRTAVLGRLRTYVIPNGELVETGDDVILRLEAAEDNAALIWAQKLLRNAAREAGVEPDTLRKKAGSPPR